MLKLKYTALMVMLVMLFSTAVWAERPVKEVAVTIDDLPFVGMDGAVLLKSNTKQLLKHLKDAKIPAVGFVNTGKLFATQGKNPEFSSLLTMWLDAGLQLGNHTYAHKDMHEVPWSEFREDVIKGEMVVKKMVEKREGKYQYFRHPYLHTGKSAEAKKKLALFLKQRGYIEAPVTIDNSDWLFARAYFLAVQDGKKESAQRVVDEYIPYMMRKFAYYEQQCNALFGRPVRHILLLHANRLNADHLDKLVQAIKKRGYRFISLEEALKDPAYGSEDNYSGKGGISWLHRWALTKGKKGSFFEGEPETADFVKKLANIKYE